MGTSRALGLGLVLALGCGPQPYAPPAPRGSAAGAQQEGSMDPPPDTGDTGNVGSGSTQGADDGGVTPDLLPVQADPDLSPPPPVPGSTMPGTCSGGNGVYCGGNGVTGDSRALYDCTNGTLTVLAVCDVECVHAPPGSPDYCR